MGPAQLAKQPPTAKRGTGVWEGAHTRDLPGRDKPVGKMSPWLVSGCSHHCHLPKDRAKSAVAAEPTITVDYVPALPGAQCSPHPCFEAPSSSWLQGQHHCSKISRCASRCHLLQGWPGSLRASWAELAGRACSTPSPGVQALASPCLTSSGIRKEPGTIIKAKKMPHNPPSSSGFKREWQQ